MPHFEDAKRAVAEMDAEEIENPRAFPGGDGYNAGNPDHAEKGMTLRDYFAAKILPSVIAATSDGKHTPPMESGEKTIHMAMARDAYLMADAMLKARMQ